MKTRIGHKDHGKADEALLANLLEEENRRINQEVSIERLWWGNHLIADESIALENGSLILIPDQGEHYRLIHTLRSGEEPRSLSELAYRMLLNILYLWQMENILVPNLYWSSISLSIVSLYRSKELQKRLAESSNLASKGFSAHGSGNAIDFDPNGYYYGQNKQPMPWYNDGFVQEYMVSLKKVLEYLDSIKMCHVIWERRYKIEEDRIISYLACYHVCVSPNFVAIE